MWSSCHEDYFRKVAYNSSKLGPPQMKVFCPDNPDCCLETASNMLTFSQCMQQWMSTFSDN